MKPSLTPFTTVVPGCCDCCCAAAPGHCDPIIHVQFESIPSQAADDGLTGVFKVFTFPTQGR